MVQFIIGMLGLSLTLSYAWWLRVRVVCLRQDLFDIRDHLFDRAADLKRLDDPAHVFARDHLNRLASGARYLSILVVAGLLMRGVGQSPKARLRTPDPGLQAEIDQALEASSARVAHYLMYHTITGLAANGVLRTVRLGAVIDLQVVKWSRRVLFSNSPDLLEDAFKEHRPTRVA